MLRKNVKIRFAEKKGYSLIFKENAQLGNLNYLSIFHPKQGRLCSKEEAFLLPTQQPRVFSLYC